VVTTLDPERLEVALWLPTSSIISKFRHLQRCLAPDMILRHSLFRLDCIKARDREDNVAQLWRRVRHQISQRSRLEATLPRDEKTR